VSVSKHTSGKLMLSKDIDLGSCLVHSEISVQQEEKSGFT